MRGLGLAGPLAVSLLAGDIRLPVSLRVAGTINDNPSSLGGGGDNAALVIQ